MIDRSRGFCCPGSVPFEVNKTEMLVRRRALVVAAGILAALLWPARLSARDTSVAVIVNPRNSIESISLAELRSIFLGTQVPPAQRNVMYCSVAFCI